jgi:porin
MACDGQRDSTLSDHGERLDGIEDGVIRTHLNRNGAPGAAAAILALIAFFLAGAAIAQPVDVPPTWGGDFWDRPRLTGSWFGLREEMGKKGVVLDLDLLLTPQGVGSGGRDTEADFWGNAEYTLKIDTQKLGLWPGGFLNAYAITGFGDTVNQASGTFLPSNFATFLPDVGTNQTALMNLTYTQFLSPKFAITAGKNYTLAGGDANAFAHDFHSQFMNSALNFNATLVLVPLSAYGGGVVVLPWEGAQFAASVADPSGTPTNNDISEAFRDGVLVAAEGRVTVKPFGLVGHQTMGFVWSNKERTSLEQDPSNIARSFLTQQFPRLSDPGPVLRQILERFFPQLLVPVQPLNTTNYTWSIYYNFDQYLWSPAGRPDQGIGVFFRFGASDGVANPVKYAYNVGFAGNGIVPGRPRDTFGLGWARTELSHNFVPFLREQLDLGLNKEDAIEMYYNASIAKWLNATLDLQIIDQALDKKLDSGQLTNMGTAVIGGLRLYMRF